MAEVYGNVNVKYNPCKSIAQLKSAADYILGKRKEQMETGIEKTCNELYNAFGCHRDNFANSLIITRKCTRRSIPDTSRRRFWHRKYPFPFIRRIVIN